MNCWITSLFFIHPSSSLNIPLPNLPLTNRTQPHRQPSSQTMLRLLFAIASVGIISAKSASAEMAGSFAMSRECEFLPAAFDSVGRAGCPPGYACVEQSGSSLGGICKEEEQVDERVLQTVDPCGCEAKKCCGDRACALSVNGTLLDSTIIDKIPVGSCCGDYSCIGLPGESKMLYTPTHCC